MTLRRLGAVGLKKLGRGYTRLPLFSLYKNVSLYSKVLKKKYMYTTYIYIYILGAYGPPLAVQLIIWGKAP